MSTEHRLTTGEAGLYGKHPGFGDFIAAGLPEAVFATLGDWLQAVLGDWRAAAGDGWQAAFDAAPHLGFWIGAGLIGGAPLRGVWAPSRDRAGRRFPLLVLQSGGGSPVLEPGQDFHQAARQAIDALAEARHFDPRDAASRLRAELPAPPDQPAPDWPTFWAVNPQLPVEALLGQLREADHLHATSGRSYWWFANGEQGPSGLLSCQGWPGPSEMGWLIGGGGTFAPTGNLDGGTA